MRSLQLKLTVALLVTSLTAIAIVGAIARWFVFQEFNQAILELSFGAFQQDVEAYFNTYGTWEDGSSVEPFNDFVQRRRPVGRTVQPQFPLDELPRLDEQFVLLPERPSGPPLQVDDVSPHPLPDPVVAELERPPFQFLLLAPDSKRILLSPEGYDSERDIPSRFLEQREVIVVDNRPVAIAIPVDAPNLNELDKHYLASLNRSLLYGMAWGSSSALILGLLLGGQLSAPLRQLKQAIQAMTQGDLHQEVPVRSPDEIGMLAAAFNHMSSDLAEAYDSLQESHATIQIQAEQLKELSIRDELTKLFNRRYFNEQSARAFAVARRHHSSLSFALGDIDRFKQVNDQFSHGAGDEVLRRVAQIVMATIREGDLAARYGGEEFVISFPETSLDGAAVVCERLRQAIENYAWSDINPQLRVTMSIGLSSGTHSSSFETAIAAADRQLYRAKNSGRNQVSWAVEEPYSTVASEGASETELPARTAISLPDAVQRTTPPN